MNKKKVIHNQKYEKYWKLTLEYSNIYGVRFNRVLKEIVNFIDSSESALTEGITSKQYHELQNIISNIFPKCDDGSTRKSINQFLKLGFINNKFAGYHPKTKDFLNSSDKNEKSLIFSKILYENSSFNRSFSNDSSSNEIQFLIKTLESCGKITKDQLLAIMYIDVDKINSDYLTIDELKKLVDEKNIQIKNNNAINRKYNQLNYLFNLCKYIKEIHINKDYLSLSPLEKDIEKKTRDPYLQRLYKIELINESKKIYHKDKGICVLEKIAYPILIASHIKPYRLCTPSEEFDVNNGLLLSKNLDSLFDLGYISFDDDGKLLYSKDLDITVINSVKNYQIDPIIFNDNRKKYMSFHRENIFKY